ncbi:MAG TPA: DHA2 family efflux MFS transporter permease subunit [Thermoleophilaceae bacterium]|nr:DHA2 family efflux MFS transporter permease subunit [Thermoleophilaceae bacterium]
MARSEHAPPDQPPATGGRLRAVLIVCSLAAFMAFLDATIVNIAFPDIEATFDDVSRSWLSWVLNGYNIVFAALLVPAGQLADLVGRKRVFMCGLAGFTVASLLCAIAPSAETLVLMRVVQAVGAALLVPTALGLLLGELPEERRIGGVAMLGASAAVAAAIGPSLGGFLIHVANWRLVFLVNVPLGAIAFVVGWRVLREQRDPEQGRLPDVIETGLLTLTVALIALGLTQGPDWGWGSARVVGSFAGAAVLLAAVAWRSRSDPHAMSNLSFRLPSVRFANVAILIFAAAFYGKILTDVLFLTSIWHYTVLGAGAAITPGPLITAVCAAPAGRLADRFGLAPVAAVGTVVYGAGCAWYALRAGTTPDYVADWLPGTLLTGVGIAMAFPTLTTAAVAALPPRLYATGSGLNATARQLGGVLGIAVVIAILGHAVGAHDAFVGAWTFVAVAAVLSTVATLMLQRASRRPG